MSLLPAGLVMTATSAQAGAVPAMELDGSWAFSPNGDGRHDVARYAVELRKRAKVTLKVLNRDGDVVRGPVRLGEHRAGSTVTWHWKGRDNSGRRVADNYRYTVRAKARTYGGTVATDSIWLSVDTQFSATLDSNFDTVYPRSTVVTDRIRFGTTGLDDLGKGTLQIRSAGGETVFSKTARWTRGYPYEVAFPVAWNGRGSDGEVLPAGEYFARVESQDHVGNRGRTKRIPVHVSRSRLTEATSTIDVTPTASYIGYNPCANSTANGCGDYAPCGVVVPSTSYPTATDPGALSYRSSTGCGPYTWQDRAVGWHALPRPADSPRGTALGSVTMRGKPANAGETDTASLAGGGGSATTEATTRETTTTVDATTTPNLQDLVRGESARWAVATVGTDWFDAASFRVTYTYLRPTP